MGRLAICTAGNEDGARNGAVFAGLLDFCVEGIHLGFYGIFLDYFEGEIVRRLQMKLQRSLDLIQ